MRLKLGCDYCPRGFYKEHNLFTHILFEHFHMPENMHATIWLDNIKLITKFQKVRKNLSTYKTEMKKRFLKSMYGRKYDMNDEKQDYLFNDNLGRHHDRLFTRLAYVRHDKYDDSYNEAKKLLSLLEKQGLIRS